MPITFGSVGDIISISLLVKDAVKALDDSGGSASEYQGVIRELWSLDRVLLEVELLSKKHEQTIELNALCVTARRVAEDTRKCIENFLKKIKKYDASLGDDATGNFIRGISMKIKWRLVEKDELDKFRAEINAHCSSMNMLLAVASVYMSYYLYPECWLNSFQESYEHERQEDKGTTNEHRIAISGQPKRVARRDPRSPGTEHSTFEICEIPSGNHFRYIAA